jgi:hypothetical protein
VPMTSSSPLGTTGLNSPASTTAVFAAGIMVYLP